MQIKFRGKSTSIINGRNYFCVNFPNPNQNQKKMRKCTHVCVSKCSKVQTNNGRVIVETIKYLLENCNDLSHVVHFHFNPKKISNERCFKKGARVTETYFDTHDLTFPQFGKHLLQSSW